MKLDPKTRFIHETVDRILSDECGGYDAKIILDFLWAKQRHNNALATLQFRRIRAHDLMRKAGIEIADSEDY